MKAVVDRIVQYANRYQLTNVETGEVLGTFDFEEVTGTVQQVGTEIDKELFDSIANDLAARVKLSGGELAETIVTFSDISGTAANVASGDTSATLWGKVKNWFSRLKALAFKNKVAAGDFEAGAIKNADVAADAAIAQSKVSGLMTDYVASISVSGRTVTYKNKNGVNMGSITTQDTTYELASQSSNGLMSSTDKTKLDGIESGAQRNTVLGVKGSSESAYRTGNVNITKANIGLGNVDNTSDEDKPVSTATKTALNGKANTSGTYPNLTVGKATNTDNATNATNATVHSTVLVPSNTDINAYRGENYWGKTFYAGGNNTVQNTPIAGIAFSLEVLRSGAFATLQRITMMAVSSNNMPTVYTRSVADTTTTGGEGTWTAWTEVAEANGTYPDMTVGKAQESNNNLLLNGDFKLNTQGQSVYPSNNLTDECVDGWITVDSSSSRTGSVEVVDGGGIILNVTSSGFGFRQEIVPAITGAGKSYVLTAKVSAVNGNSVSLRIMLRNTTYTASYASIITTEAGTFTANADVPSSATGNLQVYVAVEGGTVTEQCSYTIDWIKLEEGSVSTAPNGLVQNATEALYARKAKEAESAKSLYYGIRVLRGTGSDSVGWYKFATIPYLSSQANYTYSGIILVNGEYGPQQTTYAAESGTIEVDVRVTSGAVVSTTSGISILSGNLNPAEYCLVCESDNTASLYVYIQQQYGSIKFTTVSESAGSADVHAEYESAYYGSTAPSGAVYAVVRNNASGDEDGNNIKETYAKKNDVGTVVKTATEWQTQNPVLSAGQFGYDTTNEITKVGDGSTLWSALPFLVTTDLSFAKASWKKIAILAENGDARNVFSVGDEKTINLTNGTEVTLVILGFNHDDLTSGGKAGITIGTKELLPTSYYNAMNGSNTNIGGWNDSRMRTSTMATILSQLPNDLQEVIKSVDKKTTNGGKTTSIITSSDKLFLLSEVEIDGTEEDGYTGEGEQYEYWKKIKNGTLESDRVKHLNNGTGGAGIWWLRSPIISGSVSFRAILQTGSYSNLVASNTVAVSFAFCV